ncbi:MAG: DUF3566 domain-containing protein [Aeromicrobium sp.]|uniref:DUF3566 domain-containing protein n=1 Tax=Aeromicrobium sp. TaxID=1871063 RepID=UPI0039E4891F
MSKRKPRNKPVSKPVVQASNRPPLPPTSPPPTDPVPTSPPVVEVVSEPVVESPPADDPPRGVTLSRGGVVESTVEPEPAVAKGPRDIKRPMTAADYARTVEADPASTSVFPKVEESAPASAVEPKEPKPQSVDTTPVTRQARLSLVHVDPWSVTQLAFVVSTALMVVTVVAVTVFWLVLSVTGVWDNLNDTVNSVLSAEDGTFDVKNYFGFGRVVGLTLVLSAINVILMTALAAIGARLYNAATHLVGGVQLTFRERS